MTVLVGALVIVVGTWLGAPTLAPVIGGVTLGLIWPQRAARAAALAGVTAWGGLLLLAILRGDDVARLGSSLGAAMGLPGWALLMTTLVYPAILASSAAWLAHLVSPRSASTHAAPARRATHP
jgi:hypothetical protein